MTHLDDKTQKLIKILRENPKLRMELELWLQEIGDRTLDEYMSDKINQEMKDKTP